MGSSMLRTFMTKSFALKLSLLLFAIVFGLCYCFSASEAKYENCESVVSKPAKEGFLATLEASVRDQLPGLNVGEVAHFEMHSLTPNMSGWALYGVALFAFVVPLILYISWRELRDNEECSARIGEDRSDIYRQNPGAMRLVGASSYMSESFEPVRAIDPVYDVPPGKELESWLWRLVPAFVLQGLIVCVLILGKYEIIKLQRLPELMEDWGPMLVLGCFGIGIPMAVYCLLTEGQERRVETKIETNSPFAQFHKSAFYLYHDRVLEELGFEQTGTLLCCKHRVASIYLSKSGNLLVELVQVGFGAGSHFFALATVTNDGKFLETSSSVKPKHERRDVNMRFQRRSASHGDFVRALTEHDRLVGEFTYGGTVQEAQFTEENYERFLRWGAKTYAI